jgi:hypothetical protein
MQVIKDTERSLTLFEQSEILRPRRGRFALLVVSVGVLGLLHDSGQSPLMCSGSNCFKWIFGSRPTARFFKPTEDDYGYLAYALFALAGCTPWPRYARYGITSSDATAS